MMKETFVLPDFSPLLKLRGASNNKIVVISIVGKTPFNTSGVKVKAIDRVFTTGAENDQPCTIEGCYNKENHIIYLHLHSLLDTDVFMQHYEKLLDKYEGEGKSDDFLAIYDEVKSSFARALLLLLHISHIVVLAHPGSTFDTNYIQYFKAVDALSQKIYCKIFDHLKNVEGLSQDWLSNGRLCMPRVIFYFDKCPKGVTNIKKVEHSMEDKIYHILKKTRIISSYGSAMFAIPMNEEFVFMAPEEPSNDLGDMIKGLINDCQPGGAMQMDFPFCDQPYSDRNFMKFLQVHVTEARTKGFNDVAPSTRHQPSVPLHFELPLMKHWIDSTKVLYGIVMRNILNSYLCTDTRFSEQRCLKVLPLAVARYQEGLPPHYGLSEHERRLTIALSLFNAQARGPAFHQYVTKLRDDCQAYWENGRQQCEAASMTGNPCKLPKHPSDQEHISGFVYKSLCDCGRKVGPREDPYTARQANHQFYQQMGKECTCAKLERVAFPAFQPSIKEFRAATLGGAGAAAVGAGGGGGGPPTSVATATEEPLSALSDRSQGGGDLSPGDSGDKPLVRQPSTTEYLPGMLTLASPPGLLPVYSSWSLVCLGPSSLYSHNLGLSEAHHPGFLSSTNYLLPWDVTVHAKASGKGQQQSWPQVPKYPSRGRRGQRATVVITSPTFSVKVFIGVEYECSSGHRFMLAAPDKVLKATPGSIVKDTGHKIAESDMPLYYPCMCRANKVAQLMRLHVVTPKAPVHCTLDPRVQPAPGAPIFIPTTDRPTKLTQSAYWVMRLPYVYVSDKEHYQQNLGARMLQGVFGVSEME